MFGVVSEESADSYDTFVETVRDRLTEAYQEVPIALGRAAERNKKYYDLRVRPNSYQVVDWVTI